MASDYFGPFTRLAKGTKARADAVNALFDAVETGLDKLPTENAFNRGTHNYAANTGAANAYTATLSHVSTSYATGQEVDLLISPGDINTAVACTLNISGIGGVSIKYPGGSNPAIGDLVGTCKFRYSGTVWHFISTAVNQPAYAEEWATKAEDSLVSTAAGGDGATDYSSLHHAAKASSSASASASSASAAATSATTAAASADMVEQFKATEAATPDMTALIKAGKLMYGGTLASQAQQTTTTITAPVGNPRIDRIVIDEQTGAYSIVAGTEAASPSAPAIPAGKLPVCQILLDNSPATTAITDSLITDERIITRSYDATLESHGVLAPYKNLVIKNNATNPTYQIDIDADTLNLGGVLVSGVNLTVDLTIAAGINGLDTGTETNNTIYHIWGITNGTTTAGLISLSSTWAGVNKTNISGYDYAGYLGAFFNTAISINTFEQHGNKVACLQSVPTLGVSTSYASVTTTEIPPTAKRISGFIQVTNTSTAGERNVSISPVSNGSLGEVMLGGYTSASTAGYLRGQFNLALLTAQTFYYKVLANSSATMNITGWEY